MKRFKVTDNDQLFQHELGFVGRLEYPLDDPGSARPGEGILWFEIGGVGHWRYVSPREVTRQKMRR